MSHILKSKKKHALVYLGCYNKILQTGWLINNRNLFLTVPEGEKPKVKPPADFTVDERPGPGSWLAVFSLCLQMAEGVKELSRASFIRKQILLIRALLLRITELTPQGPTAKYHHIKGLDLVYEFVCVGAGGHKHLVYRTENINFTNVSLLIISKYYHSTL